jgi:hypothetical protein
MKKFIYVAAVATAATAAACGGGVAVFRSMDIAAMYLCTGCNCIFLN